MKIRRPRRNDNTGLRIIKSVLPSALAVLFLCAASAMAEDVFERLEAKEKETSAVSFDFTQTVKFDIQDYTQVNIGAVLFQRPENLRIELKRPVRQITISDGKKLRNYNADTNQMIISDWKKIKETGMLFGWPDSFAGNISSLKSKYSFMLVESSTDTTRLVLEDKKSGFSMTMEFDAATLCPLSTELASKGVKITTAINNFKRNPVLSKDAFKFTPPKGAEIIRP
ncbi:MAG: outer membrane lipoprotein carrier protein LolA [Endomicrobiia bacterium]|nr:outer membrane lipoprotein carrier protein LolA [Endomicrobiia bacterium]